MPTRLLYVDGEPDLRDVVENQLMLEGFDVTTAADGMDAIEILTKRTFDVVLLDVRMPRMNGIDVLQALHALNIRPRTIMLTGDSDVSVLARCAHFGVNDYLTKPYNFRDLVNSIGRVMTRVFLPQLDNAAVKE